MMMHECERYISLDVDIKTGGTSNYEYTNDRDRSHKSKCGYPCSVFIYKKECSSSSGKMEKDSGCLRMCDFINL